jgi:F-box and WD-40 domain protein CDC4
MAARYTPPRSLSQRRASLREAAEGDNPPRSVPEPLTSVQSRISGGRNLSSNLSSSHPKPLPTPNKSGTSLPPNLLPSAPASPPTPAPSPTPHQRTSSWQYSEDDEDTLLLNARMHFSSLSTSEKQRFLVDILNLCDNQQLSFVSSFVSPRLRKDPFQVFPNELCLRVRRGEPASRGCAMLITTEYKGPLFHR